MAQPADANRMDDGQAAATAAGPAAPWRRRLLIAAKLAVSLGLLAWMLTGKIDLSDALRRLAAMPGIELAGAFAACLMSYGIITVRWRLILRALGMELSLRDSWSITWIGMFFNQALPSNVAGDVMRVWRIRRHGLALGRAVSSVMIDRVVALAGLALLVAGGLPVTFRLLGGGPAWHGLLAGVLAIAGGVAAVLLFDRALGPMRARLPRRMVEIASALGRDARAAFLHPRIGPAALALSVVNFGVAAGIVWLLALGLDVRVAFLHILVLFPPVLLVSMLPVSFAGWGVRELAMVTALGYVGVPDVEAVALSIAFGLVLLASTLPGGLIWFLTGNRRRAA